MQPTWGKEAEQYREKVQGFLAEHIPADNHLLAPRWPAENGGPGLTEPETVALAEEFATAGVPTGGPNDVFGIEMVGKTILQGGTEDQKREFIPQILSGEHRWCQGYSEPEPDAGSDLGDLDGEEWVIDGQKIWTSAGEMVLGLSEEPGPEGAGASWKALQQRS